MNGGSQRKSIGDVICWVRALDWERRAHTFAREHCEFAYRSSAFQRRGMVIIAAELTLQQGNPRTISRQMLEVLRSRRKKFPRHEASCGSVFIGEPHLYESCGPPGKVIEDTGCKGWRVGEAQVSSKHANFIVNHGRASAADILTLIARVRQAVHDRTGHWLRCEVKFVSPDARLMPAHEALPQAQEDGLHRPV